MAVLWIVAVVGFIAVTFSFQTRTELKAAYYARQRLEAQMLAESAIAQAQALLDEDDPSVDHLGEDWADAAAQFADVPLTGLADGVYSVMGRPDEDHETLYFGLVDECGKVNLNTATREMLLALPGVTAEIADAIIDWRDQNEVPEPSGAETPDYEALPYPYTCKNEAFESVDELLLVRGITSEILYGEDANRNGLLDPNEDDGDERPPKDDRNGILDDGLYRYVTVWSRTPNVNAAGDERVYLNAPWQELQQALSGVIDDPQVVAAIVNRRRQGNFQTVADVLGLAAPSQSAPRGRGRGGRGRSGNPSASASSGVPVVTEEVFAQIVDDLTVTQAKEQAGLINPNTAPPAVLQALPGLADEDVMALVAFRETTPEAADSIAWVLQVLGPEKFKPLAGLLTVRSHQFSGEAVGRFTNKTVFKRIRVVFDRRSEPLRIVYWQDLTGLGVAYPPPEADRESFASRGL